MGTDLLSILVGAGIAAIVRRYFTQLWWLVVPIVGIAVGFLPQGVLDLIEHGEFFRNPREIAFDAISFSAWGLIAGFVFWFIGTVRRLDT